MRRILIALMLTVALPAFGADNTVILTPGSGVTMRTQDVGSGVQSPYNILGNTSGTSIYGTAGTANASILSVQGIASMTPLLATLSGTNNIATVTTVTTVSTVTSLSQFGGNAINLGAGAVGTGTLRITQASDSPEIAVLGAAADSAATAGSTGTLSAKLRLMTSQLDAINTNIQAGAGATASSVPASAIYAACRGQSAEATAVTNGQLVGEACSLVGKVITMPYANPENVVSGSTSAMTGTTTTSVIASAGGSLRNYITACTFSNSHATVGTMILLQDGSGGATLWQAPAAAVFGGAHVVFPTPIRTTAATALFTANVTTGANTFVSCTGYKGI